MPPGHPGASRVKAQKCRETPWPLWWFSLGVKDGHKFTAHEGIGSTSFPLTLADPVTCFDQENAAEVTLGQPLTLTLKVTPSSLSSLPLSTGASPMEEVQLPRDHHAVRKPKLAMWKERGRQTDGLQGGVWRTHTSREPPGSFPHPGESSQPPGAEPRPAEPCPKS